MSSIARKPAARHAKPAQRHFAKKAPKDARDVDDSSDEEQEQEAVDEENEIGTFGIEEDVESFTTMVKAPERSSKPLKVALGNVQVEDGRVIVDGQVESGKTLVEQQVVEEEEESSESESEEEESSEEESESEDEPAPKPQLRPVFVQKRAREALKEREGPALDSEEAIKKREAAAEERRKQSRQMAGETVKRGLEEKEAQEPGKEIDDTDGKDPEEEFQAWRMRELMRLKREKEAERQKEEERMEVERRRAMPEEQRLKEDLEHAKKLREAKPQGGGAFLQKYWHKGAFYQEADIIKNRDYSKPTESQVDISLLPKIMQVKDFGKRSRTKYTHLKDQDTTVQSAPKSGIGHTGAAPSGQSCFLCGGPHLKRDCPQNTGQGPPGTGTNATGTSSSRQWGEKSERQPDWRNRSPQPRHRSRSRDDDRYGEERRRDRDGHSKYDRRSRSPSHRHRSDSHYRKKHTDGKTAGRRDSRSRSPVSRHRDDHDSKRRRLD